MLGYCRGTGTDIETRPQTKVGNSERERERNFGKHFKQQ